MRVGTGDRFWVYLDGEPIRDVIQADDELGFVLRYKTDADGKLKCGRGTLETEKLTGCVRLVAMTPA